MSDFSMFYTGWHQLSPIGYLPMQFGKGVKCQAFAV